jgi:signal transduction histidine kinase
MEEVLSSVRSDSLYIVGIHRLSGRPTAPGDSAELAAGGSNVGQRLDMRTRLPLASEVEASDYTVIDNLEPEGRFGTVPVPVQLERHTYALRVHGDSTVGESADSFPERSIVVVDPEIEPLRGVHEDLLALATVMARSGALRARTPQCDARDDGPRRLERTAVASMESEFAALAAHIAQRREAILQAWRQAVASDPLLTSGASLPRAQLHDHIPALLVDFEQRLAAGAAATAADVEDARKTQKGDAAAHGLHRWQQGFDLAEVTRELSKLNECVVVELDSYAVAQPELDAVAMASARRIWAQQYGAAVGASTSQYFRLQQLESNSHIRDLEHALEALRQLEQQRAQLWQQAAHDLRGNLGVVTNATEGLTSARASELARESFLRLLDRNVSALRYLLNDVTSLARLQGGQEHRNVERMDAAALLHEVCEGLQAYAQERTLFLRFNGPAPMWVEGDPVKIRRITQNLVLNAIKYTRQGGVTMSWGGCEGGEVERWFVQVQDTGPGFHAGAGPQLADALQQATDQARQISADATQGEVTHADGGLAETGQLERSDSRPVHPNAGEGIGLSIVKRLCELLDATLDVQSKVDAGTTFRILLPRRYADGS